MNYSQKVLYLTGDKNFTFMVCFNINNIATYHNNMFFHIF